MCGEDGFTQSTFDGLSHFCLVCSGGFEESYLICVFLLFICTWGFVFTILCYSLFCFLFFSFWEKLLENCFLLVAIFHMEHNINFLFSIVAIFLVCYTFHQCSELLWLLLAGGKVVHVCSVTQLFLTLCDPMDCSPPGFSVHGIILARILEWVSISSSEDLLNSGIKPAFPVTPALRWIPYHWAIGESPKIISDSPLKLHQ